MKGSSCANKLRRNQLSYFLPVSFTFTLVIFFFQSYSFSAPNLSSRLFSNTAIQISDPCNGRYVYMYDLPEIFNTEILRDCKQFNRWKDLCPTISNAGLGPRLNESGIMFQGGSWFNTHQFTVSLIFHNRMKQYECLTTNYSISSAAYIPYYVGLDIARHLWDNDTHKIDLLANKLINLLQTRPEWKEKGGRDHFVVVGRTMWDFQRGLNTDKNWGSKFSLLPEVKNMTILTVEARRWVNNEFGIPYPTYFHPSNESEVILWQNKMRSMERPWLFSFVGAPRREAPHNVRNFLIDQCSQVTRCNLQQCGDGGKKCYSPSYVMGMFQSSNFCLQPPGDSYTRRSVFDSMLAGCIPVLFNPLTAYRQYIWHLPKNFNKFSVYIPEKAVVEGRVNVEDVLLGYSSEQIREMREEVIKLIPTLIYNDPRQNSNGLRDAFDVAVDGVIKMIRKDLRR
ncbi:hypothetical protein LUZ60_015290 [Juncus effusus]|nr:hypothetical protein LUZ60_015290 [Juncus effusus]